MADTQSWDVEVDAVVIGSGAGGLTAAVVAAAKGLDVLVIEKSRWIGGTSAISGGAIWLPDPEGAGRIGITDSVDNVMTYLSGTVGAGLPEPLARAFLKTGPEMLDFLERNSRVKTVRHPGSPDYRSSLPGGATGGRRVDCLPFDGRLLGEHLLNVRPPLPEFLLFGGMMVNAGDVDLLLKAKRSWKGFVHAARLIGRYAFDRLRWPRGTRLVVGNALVGRLLRSLLDRGGRYWLNTPAERLIKDNGTVVGIEVRHDGKLRRIRARRGVVLATGGFSANADMVERLLPEFRNAVSVAPLDNTGDGVRIGTAAGASFAQRGRTGAFWAPASVRTREDGTQAVYPHFFWDRAKPGMLAVRRDGRRFFDETRSYHDFVMAMADPKSRRNDDAEAYLICDRDTIDRWGLGMAKPGGWPRAELIRSGYLVEAATLAALAEKLGVDRDEFAHTVTKFNTDAAKGVDTEFGRGSDAYGRALGDPTVQPNPCMGPVRQGPFYAVTMRPGIIGTSAGLSTNADASVLDDDEKVIPGLYACGNDMASIMAGEYPGPGITLGPAMTFGYAAARHMAGAGSVVQPSNREKAA
ncbi:FAD-dependent oxidoreductase [Bradyrhizobium sp.]|uniref:FAD-dependent oxidoreductase n=1 Tax=Bradyrhizobium sp. TaxID=376 RepID=UPI0039E64CCA